MEIRFGGLGGQGVILAGEILGRAAVYDDKNVVQTQSYGAEARGSAAKSEIIVSDRKIWFPFVRCCDVLVVMSQSALDQYLEDLREDGVLFVDGGLVKNLSGVKAKVFSIPATEVARKELGRRIFANMVMLGYLVGVTGVVSVKALEKAVFDSVPDEMRDYDLRALRVGLDLV
jgi:2-oxoglutarate ferredoxin oxidoreductase subunit gamma